MYPAAYRDAALISLSTSSRSSMSSQLRLETIHLTRGDTDDFWAMNSNS
jgi:hypothetical protein